MAMETLRSGFGYSKKSVCAYIAALNQDFSQRLLEKDAQCTASIQALESRIAALSAENEVLRSKEQAISAAILDVQLYASQLRAKAQADHTRHLEENQQELDAQRQRLEAIRGDVSALRGKLQSLMGAMDAQLAGFAQECDAAMEQMTEVPAYEAETVEA